MKKVTLKKILLTLATPVILYILGFILYASFAYRREETVVWAIYPPKLLFYDGLNNETLYYNEKRNPLTAVYKIHKLSTAGDAILIYVIDPQNVRFISKDKLFKNASIKEAITTIPTKSLRGKKLECAFIPEPNPFWLTIPCTIMDK